MFMLAPYNWARTARAQAHCRSAGKKAESPGTPVPGLSWCRVSSQLAGAPEDAEERPHQILIRPDRVDGMDDHVGESVFLVPERHRPGQRRLRVLGILRVERAVAEDVQLGKAGFGRVAEDRHRHVLSLNPLRP